MLYLSVIVIVAVVWWLSRRDEIFCVSIRDGRVLVVRGRIPAGLLADFRDIAARARIRHGTVRGVRGERGARLSVSGGIDGSAAQRMRNAFGLCPTSRLSAAPPIANPTLGQMLGIAWIAWLLDRSRWI